MGTVAIRFCGDLAAVARAGVEGSARVPAHGGRSVKDAIESCGVPHTEADVVTVDGEVVGFDAKLRGGETVVVQPSGAAPAVPSPTRPGPLRPARFVADVHLGRLAQRLRLLGLDTAYRNDRDDDELAALSAAGPRWLLTRDRGLLMRASVTHGYLVRADEPDTQAVEVVRRFALASDVALARRCARCNGRLAPVAKGEVAHRLEPATRRDHEVFRRCDGCGQVYWEGSHLPSLRAFVARVRAEARSTAG